MKRKKTHGAPIGTIAEELDVKTREVKTRDVKTRVGVAEAVSTPVAPWAVAFCVLAILLVALVWFSIANMSVSYGSMEVQDAYSQQEAASGRPLYGRPRGYVYVVYPPLWFHLI